MFIFLEYILRYIKILIDKQLEFIANNIYFSPEVPHVICNMIPQVLTTVNDSFLILPSKWYFSINSSKMTHLNYIKQTLEYNDSGPGGVA